VEYHILLLPSEGYWEWVRACRDYVMTYGPSLTADPETAARYMAPRQVITFPAVLGAYPQANDLARWFEEQHPGVRLDPVVADTPAGLSAELGERTFEVISGYRSPATNGMLRKNSDGVAKKSMHLQGRAIDVRLPGLATSRLRDAATGLARGGVGYYAALDFVHLDTGRIRSW